ncbi:MAG: TIGR02757 family protein [Planctomycetota bacterium]|jgi:uncharacterized protein (TIGR02757 family)
MRLKEVLDKLYAKYNHKELIRPDPLQFACRYSARRDMEIAALLAAVLAYGRVEQIEKTLSGLFGRMGKSPYEFVRNFDEADRAGLLDIKHRFTTGANLCDLLELLKYALQQHGSIEKHFMSGYNKADENIIPALSHFCESLLGTHAAGHRTAPGRGLKYLLAGPAAGGAAKRLNLFLRWMVRADRVDLGLWKSIDKAKLIVPMDVHMFRVAQMLRFCRRKNISLKVAVEVTGSFVKIEPDDPVKYDFALCRIGMSQNKDDWNMLESCIASQ